MFKKLQNIKKDYLIDSYAILLFIIVSFSFKSIYIFLLPLLVILSIVQFYRLYTNRISKEYFFNVFFYLLIYATIFHRSIQTVILITLLVFLTTLYIKERPKKRLKFIKLEIFTLVLFVLIAINLTIFNPQLSGLDKYLYLFFFPSRFCVIEKIVIYNRQVKIYAIFHFFSNYISTIFDYSKHFWFEYFNWYKYLFFEIFRFNTCLLWHVFRGCRMLSNHFI